jgi:hypothetical protein
MLSEKLKRLDTNRSHRAGHAFRSVLRLISAGTVFFGLPACSWRPIEALTSLSPAVGAGTLGYNDAVGDAADQILLTNILRAKDLEPLNLSQLSSISGTVSLSGTAGFTLPFGFEGSMGGNKVTGQRSAMPSVTGSTTPTYTVTPLNTQAFTLSILQPVSPAYVLNRWQAGVSRELLLLLFIKEIDFPAPDGGTSTTTRYINDPDNEASFLAFSGLVHSLVVANSAELKAFDILDPVGPPFSLYASVTLPGKSGATSGGTSPDTLADQTGFGLITNANDGQYHVGNVISSSKAGPSANQSISKGGQLYRVYAGQVALCVSGNIGNFQVPEIAPPRPVTPPPHVNAATYKHSQAVGMVLKRLALAAAVQTSSGTANPSGGGATKGAAGGPSPSAGGGSSTQGMTAALQAGRVSAIVAADGCKFDQIVLDQFEEGDFQTASQSFIHIQWRSLSEVFDYLGAILRYNERHHKPELEPSTAPSCSTPPSSTSSPAALPENLRSPFQFPVCGDPSVVKVSEFPTEPQSAILFAVYHGIIGNLSVRHNGKLVEIADSNPNSPKSNYTRTVLSMLSALVNYAAQPTVSTTTPLRLLPIP